jgi:hypothetical protein
MQENGRKIEKRANSLLLNKEIPPDKMDIVRSLLNNNSLSKEEKYSAVIDIIKFCPDKKITIEKANKVQVKETVISNNLISEESFEYSDLIYQKYKSTKLFRKRYLIHANNRLGIGIYKRLIPTKRLIKLLRDIVSYQEKILFRLPDILLEILKDDSIDDATHFNYLRIFRRWMMESPIVKYDLYEIKWMSVSHIETELQSYTANFFSFIKLDTETKEQILLIVENKLRVLDDLKKEEIMPADSQGRINDKEKRNLKIEKYIYDYMITIRAFFYSGLVNPKMNNIISEHLQVNYGINSLHELLIILFEALVFQKEAESKYLISHYNIRPFAVSSENWDYSTDFLKGIGKDPASRKQRRLEKLKNELLPYDELYSFIKLQTEGELILHKAAETQWAIADKRHKDCSYVYNDDFLTFIDACVNYFNNSFVSFLNGSVIIFQDKNEAFTEGRIFSSSFFAVELSGISNLVSELHEFKTSNPRLIVSREEAIKILQGKIRSMFEIERFLTITGDIFNQIAEKLHCLFDMHRLWVLNGSKVEDQKTLSTPVKDIPETGAPIPFYNFIIIDFKDKRLLSDRFIRNTILSESAKKGIIINLTAFCYQLANECKDETILSRLERRKDILKMIKELNG